MGRNSSPYVSGHFGLFPNVEFAPKYAFHALPAPELAIELDAGWRMHIRMDQAGATYLRRLAVILNVAANVAEEAATGLPTVPTVSLVGGLR